MPGKPPVTVPPTVNIAMEHIATSMKDSLLALAVQSRPAVMFALLEEDVSPLCGPRGKHNPDRGTVRHGHVERASTGTSKSAISRRFVAATERALAEMISADLSELDLAALMLDGVHFGEHTCIVALGIGIDGDLVPAGAGGGLHRERHTGS